MTGEAILEDVLASAPARLVELDENAPAREGGWSKKQVLGHLIDSAANNHQRFVRGQLVPHLDFPSYAQNEWVAAQAYDSEPWPDLVNLWLLLNRHLLHVVRHIPPEKLSHTCAVSGQPPVALSDVFTDYVRHLEHHLAQILG